MLRHRGTVSNETRPGGAKSLQKWLSNFCFMESVYLIVHSPRRGTPRSVLRLLTLSITKRRKMCEADHGYTLLGSLLAEIAALGVSDGDLRVAKRVSLYLFTV